MYFVSEDKAYVSLVWEAMIYLMLGTRSGANHNPCFWQFMEMVGYFVDCSASISLVVIICAKARHDNNVSCGTDRLCCGLGKV